MEDELEGTLGGQGGLTSERNRYLAVILCTLFLPVAILAHVQASPFPDKPDSELSPRSQGLLGPYGARRWHLANGRLSAVS